MTDIVNDLRTALAERQKVMKGGGELYRRAADEIERLRDVNDQTTAALESADQRAEEAERELQVAEDQANNLAGDLAQAERERDLAMASYKDYMRVRRERDALAAVVESAVATGDQAWGTGNFDWYDLRDILAAPADALREHDAEKWDEGVNAEAHAAVTASPRIKNPYRGEQS